MFLSLITRFLPSARIWLIAGGVIAVIGVIGWLYLTRAAALSDLDAAHARYDQLQSAHSATLDSLDRARKDADRAEVIRQTEVKRRQTVEALNRSLQKGIDNAPDNGCVGPAVRSVLDGLRNAGTDHTD